MGVHKQPSSSVYERYDFWETKFDVKKVEDKQIYV